jgi:HK97 family phage portal protein
MPPEGGQRTPLAPSYTWGQQGLEAQFRTIFQPGQGIFSPGYPLAPPEPERLRLWDFPVGVNTIYTPRAYEPIAFEELRALADAHDITRLAIETRKDQLEKLDWTIKPRATRQVPAAVRARAARLAQFWRRPDGERPFATWLRELLEDLLVLDAPAIELRCNRGGEIIALDVVDGATIKLLFDDTGRRPLPPAPAYEQVIHGRPWKLLTTDDLLYLPRNPRPHKAYGFGPVEQIVMTVNIALRRQAMQLQHFTEGNVPPGLLTAPEGWTAEQIRQFQEWFDSVLAGNTGGRTRLVWAPNGTSYQAFKEAPYKDEFDEWLARIVCYAFSLPPTAFTRQINRATAETAQQAATAEGLAPLMAWVKRLADHVMQDRMGQADLEFAWADRPADPAEQAKLLDLYVRSGVYTVNEARAQLGLDPVAGGDQAMVYGTQGAAPLAPAVPTEAAARPVIKANFDPDQPRAPAGNPEGGRWTGGGETGGESAGSSRGRNNSGSGTGESESQGANSGRVWQRFPNADFRNRLAIAEQSADKPDFGYTEVHQGSGAQFALGRYQMTQLGLEAAGMMDRNRQWTGKYGIHSAAEFLASPEAQEMALTDLLNDTERQLRANGAFDFIGTKIDGLRARFTVTHAGLIAAAHREGARHALEYLDAAASYGFVTRGHDLPGEYRRVEARLRTFSDVPYE